MDWEIMKFDTNKHNKILEWVGKFESEYEREFIKTWYERGIYFIGYKLDTHFLTRFRKNKGFL